MTTAIAPPHQPTEALDLSGLSAAALSQATARLLSQDFPAWSDAAARVGHCARPVRLRGSSTTVDTATGEVLASYSSASEPDGFTRIRCGNRRESVCPSCSREYAADTWHLIAAGAAGGKGVPESVSSHPMVFATLTAPSFGAVHTAPKPGNGSGLCRPRREKKLCAHGRPAWCSARHQPADEPVGQPLCDGCYDYGSHVVWQWHAPELWRRLTIALRRAVARALAVPPSRLGDAATVQFAKVAEFQRRGAVHFHALIRLDGPKHDNFTEPPPALDAADLARLIRQAADQVELTVPGVDGDDPARILRFGTQLDARPVEHRDDSDDALTPSRVAGYIAKYATKSAQDADFGENCSAHLRRLRAVVAAMADRAEAADVWLAEWEGEPGPYGLLGKWVHMLGFRGHFSSKSRRYSTTLGALRGARRRWQSAVARAKRSGGAVDVSAIDLAESAEDETTLMVGSWQFVGMGWLDEGETELAKAAAARAREHRQARASQHSPGR